MKTALFTEKFTLNEEITSMEVNGKTTASLETNMARTWAGHTQIRYTLKTVCPNSFSNTRIGTQFDLFLFCLSVPSLVFVVLLKCS